MYVLGAVGKSAELQPTTDRWKMRETRRIPTAFEQLEPYNTPIESKCYMVLLGTMLYAKSFIIIYLACMYGAHNIYDTLRGLVLSVLTDSFCRIVRRARDSPTDLMSMIARVKSPMLAAPQYFSDRCWIQLTNPGHSK